MKTFSYVTNVRMPTQKAHGIQMVKMCEAFSRAGIDLEFVVPSRKNSLADDPFEFYGVERVFNIVYLPCVDVIRFAPRIGFVLEVATFVLSVFFRFLFLSRDRIFYTREYYLVPLAKVLGYTVVYEAHNIPRGKQLFFWCALCADAIVTNSEGVAARLKERGAARVLAYPNGIDLSLFTVDQPKESLRQKLNLPLDKKIALYTGALYDWKGIDVVVEVACQMAEDSSVVFVCVGGTDVDVKRYRDVVAKHSLTNIEFVGRMPPTTIPEYLGAADVLLLPNVPISDESMYYTSPVKLPEYMASGTPIIASDMPSIRSLVGEDEVRFVEPASASALCDALVEVLNGGSDAASRASKAKKHVEEWTWEKRARAITDVIEQVYGEKN